MRKGEFDASSSSPSSNASPSNSKSGKNMFSSFAYMPSHAARKPQHNQNKANDNDGPDDEGWLEVKRPNDRLSQWERRKDEIKANQKERNKERYKEMKEQLKIRKKAKEDAEAEEEGDDDDIFIMETIKKPPVNLTKISGKSSLIKNSLLNKDTDTFDPLDEFRSKNKTPRSSVYDRIQQSNSSPNTLSYSPTITATGSSKLKPFKSPSTFIPSGYKSNVAADNFVVENVSKKASQMIGSAPPVPAAKQRRIILSDDEDDESGKQANSHSSYTQPAGKTSFVHDMTLDGSEDDKVVARKSIKQPKKKSKQVEKKTKKRRIVDSEDEAESLPSESDSNAGRDNSDESANEDDGEVVTKNQLQDRVSTIIRQCESVSKKLQSKLSEWESDRSPRTTSERDCINLIKIDDRVAGEGGGGGSLITDQALQVINPSLKLNGYQLVGVNWIKLLYHNDVNGVLADDMGLGKTVQTIAFLSWLTYTAAQSDQSGPPHLIVVPASTLSNWANEINKFNPNLRVFTYHGTQSERANLRYMLKSQIHNSEVDVVLCTYTLFERENNKHDRVFLWNLQFDYLVLDEAHCIKNPEAFRYTHLNGINSQHRLLLSGTPVQNNVNELLALLSFLMPKVFKYDKCIAMMDALGWTDLKKNQSSSLYQLKHMLAPFVLRRLKVDVLDQLSTKETVVRKVDMTERQQAIYSNILTSYAEQRKIKQLIYAQQDAGEVNLDNVIASSRGGNISTSNGNGGGQTVEIDLTTPDKPDASAVGSFSAHKEHTDKLLGSNKVHHHSSATPIDLTTVSSPLKRDDVVEINAGDDEIVVALPAFSPQVTDVVIVESKEESQIMNLTDTLTATEAKSLFTDLRKAANHPLLLRIYYNDRKIIEEIAKVSHAHEHFGAQCDVQRVIEEIQTYSDFDLHQICVQYPHYLQKYELTADVLYDSPKMVFLRDHLPKLQAEGHRMLVFSQWTRILDLLEVLLEDMSLPYLRLDGSTAVKERQELIDTFNTDTSIPVFLLSTKAGGLGINLTSADTVILHDLDFNPENDKQAEDRCHRIGQTKPVTVYKLVAAGTVDEDIFELGEKKSQLSRAVLSTNKQADETGDITLISQILSKALMKHMQGNK